MEISLNICKICGMEIKSKTSFGCHLRKHSLSTQQYYDHFLRKPKEGFCVSCDKQTTFMNLKLGYKIFCSCKCAANAPSTQEKRKNTNLKKYGTDNQFKRKDFQDIRKQTCLEKYGVKHHLQGKEAQEKLRATNLKKYGVDSQFKRKDFQEKRKQTCLEKYGVDHASKSIKVKNKIKETNLRRYNSEYISQSIHYLISRKSKWLEKCSNIFNIKVLEPVDPVISNLKHNDLVSLQCLKCSSIFKTTFYSLYHECNRCPKCYPKGSSKEEKEIKDYISEIYKGKIFTNTRNVINPYELDIYLPDLHLAIEYNGLYWHSEKIGKKKNYHLKKLKMCLNKNIQLIQIFTDEWVLNKQIVKAYLNKLIGLNKLNILYARKCTIQEIDFKTKNKFLEKYHLQGTDKSKVNIGLFYKEELVAVMTFGKGSIAKGTHTVKDVWELNRFCVKNDIHVQGAASKLLTFFKRNYQWKEIFSYADRRWFTGLMYFKLGFKFEKETQPNYWYVKGLKRIHRFSLRKRPDEPKDIPEWVLRVKEGYFRVWDCGHLKFVLHLN